MISDSPVSNVTDCRLKDPGSIHDAKPEVRQKPYPLFALLKGLTCVLRKFKRGIISMFGNRDNIIRCCAISSFRRGVNEIFALQLVTDVSRHSIGPNLKAQADP